MKFDNSIVLSAAGTLLLGLAAPSHAVPVVWDNGGGGSAFATPENWVGDVAPVSGVDDVTIDSGPGTAFLVSSFEIGSGTTFTGTGGGAALRIATGSLTLKTGGNLDFSSAFLAESGGGQFTLEPGATATTSGFFDDAAQDTTWIADSAGVTVLENTGGLFFHRGEFIIDLTNYDLSNGDTVVFVDHNGYTDDGGIFTVLGKGGTVVTNYDQGGGDLALAVIGIVPEPSSGAMALVGLGALAMRRRRR